MRSYLKNHILPAFGDIKLKKITFRMIEDWLLGMVEKPGKTGKPRGRYRQARKRNILTVDQVKELFKEENMEEIWDNDIFHYTLNLTAASTGMRQGELQGLQYQHVHDNHIAVMHSWDQNYGLKEPKWGSFRDAPVPSKTSAYLRELMTLSPYQEPEDLVFLGEERYRPVNNKTILRVLYKALENIGISPAGVLTKRARLRSW